VNAFFSLVLIQSQRKDFQLKFCCVIDLLTQYLYRRKVLSFPLESITKQSKLNTLKANSIVMILKMKTQRTIEANQSEKKLTNKAMEKQPSRQRNIYR
jgi:hypothetical protein